MVFVLKDAEAISKDEVDETFSDVLPELHLDALSAELPLSRKDELTKQIRRVSVRKRFSRQREESCRPEGDSLIGEVLYAESFQPEIGEVKEVPLEKSVLEDIETIVKERWRYLVMQFGGVFLTEIRPNRCFVEQDKTLADVLITSEYGLNFEVLENYLKENSNGGKIQIHFSDIMLNPRTKRYDIFSITSGDTEKARIFVDLARFLERYNSGENTIIPVHLPYFERWKTSERVMEFGRLNPNGERDAVQNAEKVLRYFEEGQKLGNSVKLALETGGGESKRDGEVAYALIYKPFHFQSLMDGREDLVSLCEDVGHLNLEGISDWKDYLTESISEFHVSGNNGKEDQHTIATPKTLKDYNNIMSYLKFYAGNICAEVGKGQLTAGEFLRGVKNLAYVLFSEPTKADFENLREIENYVRVTREAKINVRNLNQERYARYVDYCKTNPVSS